MDKLEFMKKLEKALVDLPEKDRIEILYDYEEHFRNASAAGKTEVEIINSLGDPEFIAKQYITGYSRKIAETDRPLLNVVRSAWAKVRPGLVNFRERITGNTLTFGLVMALLLVILALEIFVLAGQNQVLGSQKDYQQQSLDAVIKEYKRQTKFNQGAFSRLLRIAELAQHNKDAIKTAGYIIANVQFSNTLPVLKIAKIAGSADHEVRHLNDLLEVTIIYGGNNDDSMKMVELAKQAVNGEINEAEFEVAIQYYRDHSQAKTIEEAEKNMEQAFENL